MASWERVGEAGGPLYVAVRRSLSWPPWKVLRLAVPRGKRSRSGVVALAMLWIDATGFLWLLGDTATLLFSFPLGMTERRSVLFRSLQTYVFLLVIPADAVLLLGAVVAPFLRSGMSALLGLLALPSRGLAGGAPRLPGVLGLRSWTPPSSLVLFSAVVV